MRMAIHPPLWTRLVAMVLAAAKLAEHHLIEFGNYFGSQSPVLYLNSQRETDTLCIPCSLSKECMEKKAMHGTNFFYVLYFEHASICLPCLSSHKGVINDGGCSPQFPNNPNVSSDR
jgi:hypothetical protein